MADRHRNSARIAGSAELFEHRQLLAATVTSFISGSSGGATSGDYLRAADSAPVESPQQVVEFDVATRTERVLSLSETADSGISLQDIEAALQSQGFAGLQDFQQQLSAPIGGELDPDTLDFVIGTDGRTRVPRAELTTYPRRTIGRMQVTFDSFTSGSCSGTMIGPYHFLTAGHCVFTAIGTDWADSATISLGQDDPGISDGRSEFQYYGEANATYFRTYTGWTVDKNWDHDLALVTLDRRIGNQVGWMGYGYNNDDNFFNGTARTSGYPGDKGSYQMWTQTGNARDYSITANAMQSITMDATPGQSGSGVIYNESHVYAIVSSQGAGATLFNQFKRINSSNFTDLGNWIAADDAVRAPVDRPDLVDYDSWFRTSAATMSATTIVTGQNFSVTSYPRNNGTAATGAFNVSFYASTNSIISTGDYLLGSTTKGALAPFNWSTASISTAFPNIPAGTYYVGWVIDSGAAVTEYLEGNNTGVLPGTLVVQVDADDQIAEAPLVALDSTRLGIIGDVGGASDVDIYAFDVAAGQSLAFDVDTQGYGSPLGDSFIRLFNSSGTQLAYDDDANGHGPEGNGHESYLEYTFPAAGRYYIGVSAFNNVSYNPTTGSGDSGGSYTGSYSLQIGDPDDQIAEAVAVGVESTTNTTLSDVNDVDMFAVTVTAGQIVNFDVDGRDAILRIFDAVGTQLVEDSGSNPPVGPGSEGSGYEPFIRYTFAVAGTYYVGVSSFSNGFYDPVTGNGDAGGIETGTYSLHIGTTRVIDDGEPGYTTVGSWAASSGGFTGPLGGTTGDTKYVQGDAVADRFARTSFSGLTPGQYRVLATYRVGTTNATNATYTLLASVGGTVYGSGQINQRIAPNDLIVNGKGFELIGNPIDVTGTELVVQLSDQGDGRIFSDGVIIERIGSLTPGPKAEVFDGATGVSDGTGTASFGSTGPGSNLDKVFTVRNTGDAPLTVQPVTVAGAGFTLLGANIPANTVLAPGAQTTFTVRFNRPASGIYTGSVTFNTNDVRPDHLVYSFNLAAQVTETQYIDDGDAGFSTVGFWANSSGGRLTDIKYVAGAATATKFARWTFPISNAGQYRVSASYRIGSTNASNANYRILTAVGGTQLGQRFIDQRTAANDLIDDTDTLAPNSKWEDIATINVSGSQLVVELSDQANGRVYADSIRIERLGPLATLPWIESKETDSLWG